MVLTRFSTVCLTAAAGVLAGCMTTGGDQPITDNGYILTHSLREFACYDAQAGSDGLDSCSVDIPILLDFPDEDITRLAGEEIPYFCEFDVTYRVDGDPEPQTATGRGESNFVPWSGAQDAEDYMVAQIGFRDVGQPVRSADIIGYRCALIDR